jgi:hypothetical protein
VAVAVELGMTELQGLAVQAVAELVLIMEQ